MLTTTIGTKKLRDITIQYNILHMASRTQFHMGRVTSMDNKPLIIGGTTLSGRGNNSLHSSTSVTSSSVALRQSTAMGAGLKLTRLIEAIAKLI